MFHFRDIRGNFKSTAFDLNFFKISLSVIVNTAYPLLFILQCSDVPLINLSNSCKMCIQELCSFIVNLNELHLGCFWIHPSPSINPHNNATFCSSENLRIDLGGLYVLLF